MHNKTRSLSLKEKIKSDIVQKLAQMPADAPIAPELKLAQQYGVSRGTVRQAISELVGDGLLYRIHGSGTFKNRVAVNHLSSRTEGFSEQLSKGGFSVVLEDIEISECPVPAKYASALGISTLAETWKFSRIWTVDGTPISYGEAFIKKDLIDVFNKESVTTSFLETLERNYNIHTSFFESYAGAVAASPFLAQRLRISSGSPLLRYEYYGYDTNRMPLFVDISYTIGDKYILHVSQSLDENISES